MSPERIIKAIQNYLDAITPDAAVDTLTALIHIKYDLEAELEIAASNGTMSVPEGFVEFSMMTMKKAKDLRSAGNAPTSLAYSDPYGSAIWIYPEAQDMEQLLTVAASALLLAVEPVTVEGENGYKERDKE